MAPQDYVSRSNNKKKSPYKQQAPVSQSMSLKFKLISLLTVLSIAGAGYFLWFLTGVEPATPQPVVTKPKPTQDTTEIPEPPEDDWIFYDKLKEGQDIEVGQYEVENKGPYKMQCGSFKTRQQAESMKAKIAFSGLVAQVTQSSGTNGIWYKVILGPYERKRKADADKRKLRSNNIMTCEVWLWR